MIMDDKGTSRGKGMTGGGSGSRSGSPNVSFSSTDNVLDSPNHIRVYQLNCNKSKNAMANLGGDLAEINDDSFIACLQEPNLFRGRSRDFSYGVKQFCDTKSVTYNGLEVKSDVVRAAIMVSPKILAWKLDDFSNRDVCSILIKNKATNEDIVFVSAYLDINYSGIFPDCLNNLLEAANNSKKKVIICLDANAHSTLWGSEANNSRGDTMEELVLAHELEVVNKGKKATFVGRGCNTIVDLTLTAGGAHSLISQWKVEENVMSMSDHRRIQFAIPEDFVVHEEPRSIGHIRWPLFRKILAGVKFDSVPATITKKWLDEEVDYLENKIKKVEKKATKKSHENNKNIRLNKPIYWNSELVEVKSEAKSCFRKAKKSGSFEDWEEYKKQYKIFRSGVRKAKEESWRAYTSSVESHRDVAKLVKSLQRRDKAEISIHDPSGGLGSPEETLDEFMEVLLPGSTNSLPVEEGYEDEMSSLGLEGNCLNFIDMKKIKYFIHKLECKKAPGYDRIKPATLKQLPDNVLKRLETLYKASVCLGYVPRSWKNARAVLIPKPGKEDYSKPKSFRPICLSSFLFKIMEKMVKIEVEKRLENMPLNKHQHAFRKGRSCDTALVEVVSCIEKGLLRKEFALGVFLDISGAFDNLDPNAAARGLERIGTDKCIVNWYKNYLTNRLINVEINGCGKTRSLGQGTPQGGVMSPIVWNIAFDELLEIGNNGAGTMVGYADDACFIITGHDPRALRDRAQELINDAVGWGRKVGLRFNAAKTAVVLFTNKQKKSIPDIPKLLVEGAEAEFTDVTKYLGVYIDKKLNFSYHISEKCKKAKKLLFSLRGAIGNEWGPNPDRICWAYKAMVIPMITYGSVVWAERVNAKKHLTELNKIQRLAALAMCGAVKSTPTKGLEMIFGLKPLNYLIQQTGLMTYQRNRDISSLITWDGLGPKKESRKGHWLLWQKLAKLSKIDSIRRDDDVFVLNFECGASLSNIKKYKDGGNICFFDVKCVMEGSEISETLWSFDIITNKPQKKLIKGRGSYKSPTSMSVAAFMALNRLLEALPEADGEVLIALNQPWMVSVINRIEVYSKTVYKTVELLKSLTKNRTILFCDSKKLSTNHEHGGWIVDSNCSPSEREEQLGARCKGSKIRELIGIYYDKIWNKEWSELATCRQTKRFWPSIQYETSKKLIRLNKTKLNKVVQLITGHGFNNYHLALQGICDSLCRYCGDEVEETWHLVMDCPSCTKLWQVIPASNSESNAADVDLPGDLVHLPKLLCNLADAVVFRSREKTEGEENPFLVASGQSTD